MTTDISIVRWDPSQGPGNEYIDEYEYDGGNSSSRLFERSHQGIGRGARKCTEEDIHQMG